MSLVRLDDVQAAAARLRGTVVRTPLLPTAWADPDRPLLLKPECLQVVGAFKIRGAYNAIASIPMERRRLGVVAHSSGNHAQAVAYAARAFGVPATIVIPHGAAEGKVAATLALGAAVVRVPVADRIVAATELAERDGATLVPPYDHPDVIAGQGTVGLEIAEVLPDVDAVLVPVSGGGLISGVAVAIKALCPAARVIGVEPELAADARESLQRGERVEWTPELTGRTVADGLRVAGVGGLPWEHIRSLVDDIVTVSEEQILSAVRVLALGSRLVVEPSGAVAVAAHIAGLSPSVARTVAVVSGGNIDPALLAAVLTGGALAGADSPEGTPLAEASAAGVTAAGVAAADAATAAGARG